MPSFLSESLNSLNRNLYRILQEQIAKASVLCTGGSKQVFFLEIPDIVETTRFAGRKHTRILQVAVAIPYGTPQKIAAEKRRIENAYNLFTGIETGAGTQIPLFYDSKTGALYTIKEDMDLEEAFIKKTPTQKLAFEQPHDDSTHGFNKLRQLIGQIVSALDRDFHTPREDGTSMAHGDLKLPNILVRFDPETQDFITTISDRYPSLKVDSKTGIALAGQELSCSPNWIAPEFIDDQGVNPEHKNQIANDCFCLGIMVAKFIEVMLHQTLSKEDPEIRKHLQTIFRPISFAEETQLKVRYPADAAYFYQYALLATRRREEAFVELSTMHVRDANLQLALGLMLAFIVPNPARRLTTPQAKTTAFFGRKPSDRKTFFKAIDARPPRQVGELPLRCQPKKDDPSLLFPTALAIIRKNMQALDEQLEEAHVLGIDLPLSGNIIQLASTIVKDIDKTFFLTEKSAVIKACEAELQVIKFHCESLCDALATNETRIPRYSYSHLTFQKKLNTTTWLTTWEPIVTTSAYKLLQENPCTEEKLIAVIPYVNLDTRFARIFVLTLLRQPTTLQDFALRYIKDFYKTAPLLPECLTTVFNALPTFKDFSVIEMQNSFPLEVFFNVPANAGTSTKISSLELVRTQLTIAFTGKTWNGKSSLDHVMTAPHGRQRMEQCLLKAMATNPGIYGPELIMIANATLRPTVPLQIVGDWTHKYNLLNRPLNPSQQRVVNLAKDVLWPQVCKQRLGWFKTLASTGDEAFNWIYSFWDKDEMIDAFFRRSWGFSWSETINGDQLWLLLLLPSEKIKDKILGNDKLMAKIDGKNLCSLMVSSPNLFDRIQAKEKLHPIIDAALLQLASHSEERDRFLQYLDGMLTTFSSSTAVTAALQSNITARAGTVVSGTRPPSAVPEPQAAHQPIVYRNPAVRTLCIRMQKLTRDVAVPGPVVPPPPPRHLILRAT